MSLGSSTEAVDSLKCRGPIILHNTDFRIYLVSFKAIVELSEAVI